ncbi:MAG: hypothetical protein ACFCVD_12895 [Nodosilinea sp.]
MNRYIFGGIAAALVMMAMSGLEGINRLFSNTDSLRGDIQADESALGTLPIGRAGQIVQRQSGDPAAGTRAASDSVSNTQGFDPTLNPQNNGGQVAPNGTFTTPNNIVPRTGQPGTVPTTGQSPATGQFPATGDISPTQPGLVRPENIQRPEDRELDAIPALW